jgi:hypothetical protein
MAEQLALNQKVGGSTPPGGNKKSGCSITVVRTLGVGVDRVQFPAPRIK